MRRSSSPLAEADENDALLANAPPPANEDLSGIPHGEAPGSDLDAHFYWKVAATMFDFFVSGTAMAAVGVLIPDLEKDYSLKDDAVALIFPAGVVGYLFSVAVVQRLSVRIGRRGIALVSPSVRLLAAGVLCAELPFAAILAAYGCLGFGIGLTDTAWNTWASGMLRPSIVQGFLHGSFALGCVASPPVAAMVLRRGGWHGFYYIFAILSAVEILLQGWAFRHDGAPLLRSKSNNELLSARPSFLRSRSIWLCAFFYLFYQGVEASLTDWIVEFMQRSRHTSTTASSTASSIFWIGMALGRYALGPVTERLGLRTAVTTYIISSIILQVALVFITNATVFLIFLAGIGFFIATIFPSGIILLVQQLEVPPEEQTGLVAVAIGAGQLGAAIAPLGVGFLSARLGIGRLLEVVLVFSGTMLGLWLAFSRTSVRGRKDGGEEEETAAY